MQVKYDRVRYVATSLEDLAEFFEQKAQSLANARTQFELGQVPAFNFVVEVLRNCKLTRQERPTTAPQRQLRAKGQRIVKIKGWTNKKGTRVKSYTRTLPALAMDKPVKVKAHIKKRLGKKIPTRRHTRAARGNGTNTHATSARKEPAA